jgi:translation initiation factor 5B
MSIRSPIIVTVGHIDHGKTSLLDKIRGTSVAKTEAGLITQHVGASYVPVETIRKISGKLLEKFKITLTVPGLLFIDTPGHKAFLGMRRRGGAISDLAILVVDILEGFQEQTVESLTILKEFKTPFVVAATKIDKIKGWNKQPNETFLDSFQKQREDVQEDLEKAVYKIISQLSEHGFDAERFDRVRDFKKQIAVVPVSSLTGEGIPDLLMVLAGLAQQFLSKRLQLSEIGRGNILEVKEVRGLGTTIDVILYDGTVKKGDYMVIGSNPPIVRKVKAILRPRLQQELRTEKQFESVSEVTAAAGIKIAAPDLENVVAGYSIIFVSNEKDIEKAKELAQKEVEEIHFERKKEGVIVRADTLGSLEAVIKLLLEEGIPVRKAEVGAATKQDIIELETVADKYKKAVLAFNTKVPEDIKKLATDFGVRIFESDVIYRLVEEYKQWQIQEKEKELQEKLAAAVRPCEIKVLKGTVFRQSNPAVFGVEVLRGILKPGVTMKKGNKIIDKVKEIQKEGKTISEAAKGEKVAISMQNITIGRQVKEGDILTTVLTEADKKILKEVYEKLSEDEKSLLEEVNH